MEILSWELSEKKFLISYDKAILSQLGQVLGWMMDPKDLLRNLKDVQ